MPTLILPDVCEIHSINLVGRVKKHGRELLKASRLMKIPDVRAHITLGPNRAGLRWSAAGQVGWKPEVCLAHKKQNSIKCPSRLKNFKMSITTTDP